MQLIRLNIGREVSSIYEMLNVNVVSVLISLSSGHNVKPNFILKVVVLWKGHAHTTEQVIT